MSVRDEILGVILFYALIIIGLFKNRYFRKNLRENLEFIFVYSSLLLALMLELLYLILPGSAICIPTGNHYEAMICKVYLFTSVFIICFLRSKGIIIDKYRHLHLTEKYILLLWSLVVVYDSARMFCTDCRYAEYISLGMVTLSTMLICIYCTITYEDRADFICFHVGKKLFISITHLTLLISVLFGLHIFLIFERTELMEAMLSLIVLATVQIVLTSGTFKEKKKMVKPLLYTSDNNGNTTLLEDAEDCGDDEIMRRLILYFENDKPYLDPNLRAAKTSLAIGTNKLYMSRAIGKSKFNNFNSLCNYYRVLELCRLFMDEPDSDIMDIYGKAGFASRGVFCNSFLLFTGESPAKWAKRLRQMRGQRLFVRAEKFLRFPKNIV